MADAAVAYASLPFQEQIAFFRRKGNVTTDRWTDVWQEEHDHAFMVAGANRIDLLVDLRDAVDKAISSGTGLEQFRKDFDGIVAKYGWDYTGGRNWRTRVIFETNLRASYAAGRYAQLQALKKVRPYWRYRHSDSVQHPRPQHLAWNGLVLVADDPWWDTHYPPNGWGCQCTVEALNARDLKRLGKEAPDAAPDDDMQDVIVGKQGPSPMTVQTPAGVDPGFGYAPGRSAFEQLGQNTVAKAAQLPAPIGAKALEPVMALPRARQALDDGYRAWQTQVVNEGRARGLAVPVGMLDVNTVMQMAKVNAEPAAASIMAKDAEVLRTLGRGADGASGGGETRVAPEDLAHLPNILSAPKAVLLDLATNALIYVAPSSNGNSLVVSVTYRPKGAGTPNLANTFRAASIGTMTDIRAQVAAGSLLLVQGSLD